MKPEVSIIIPTKNEQKNISKVIENIPRSIRKKAEILIIDSSTDKTATIAKNLGAKVIKVNGRKGKAIREGIRMAKGNFLVFTDGDGEYDSAFIPKMIKYAKSYDVVLGCHGTKRFKKDQRFWKEIYHLAAISANFFFYPYGVKLKDPLTGFRVMPKKIAKKLKLKTNGLEIETEMNIKFSKMKLKIKEIPVPNLRRKSGRSKYLSSFVKSMEMMIRTLEKYKNWKPK